jgi:hypothetical protein
LKLASLDPALRRKLQELWHAKDLEGCEKLAESALAALPRDAVPSSSLLLFRMRALANQGAKQDLARAAAFDGIKHYPDDPKFWFTLSRVERRLGNLVGAFAALNRIRRINRHLSGEIAAGLFGILAEKHRYRTARRLYDRAVSEGIAGSVVFKGLAEVALYDEDTELCGKVLDETPESARTTQRYQLNQAVMKRIRLERAHPECMEGLRHIAIGGVSFVGSTLFGVILGSIPGLVFGSETHWLFETGAVHPSGQRATILDEPSELAWPVACRLCGRDCRLFTPEFRRELAMMEYGRYPRIAAKLETNTLVTSDKNFNGYWLEDPLFRFDIVTLFKPLRSQVWSALKVRARDGSATTGAEAETYVRSLLDFWARDYGKSLRFMRPTGRRVVMNWNEFIKSPRTHMKVIVSVLGLPGDGDVFSDIRLTHLIGGNTGVPMQEIAEKRRVEIRPAAEPELSPQIESLIQGHREANHIVSILERRYKRDFSDIIS